MLLGVPVVSADVGGVHNLVDDGRDGILYPKDKPKRLKDSILRIFEDCCRPTQKPMRCGHMIRTQITGDFWIFTARLSMAKVFVADMRDRVVNTAVFIVGASDYETYNRIELYQSSPDTDGRCAVSKAWRGFCLYTDLSDGGG